MTPELQRIRIAEACGWKKCGPSFESDNLWHIKGKGFVLEKDMPDYLNDLNAIAPLEAGLTDNDWRIYLGFIMGARIIPRLASMDEFHAAWKATAAQRAEAFLRCIGKWAE